LARPEGREWLSGWEGGRNAFKALVAKRRLMPGG
jgi:hypothetical protein